MASRFWVAGTGNWDAADTTHWSATSGGGGGASVPGTSDTVTFNGSSGGGTVTVTATAAVISVSMGNFTGTLNTNGQSVTTSSTFNNGDGTATRTLTLGASTITCQTWIQSSTGLTFNPNTSTITVTGTQFQGGSMTYNNLQFSVTGTKQILGSNTFANITHTPSAAVQLGLAAGTTQTITGTLTLTGSSKTVRLTIAELTLGAGATLNSANNAINGCDFIGITATGAANWDLSGVSNYSGDGQGNSGITFTPAVTVYWYKNTGVYSDATKWFLGTGGTGGAGRAPLLQDNVIFDANSFDTGAQTISWDMVNIGKNVTLTGVTNNPSTITTLNNRCYGSFTADNATFTSDNPIIFFFGRSSNTLTATNFAFVRILMEGVGGTLTLGSDITYDSTSSSGVWAGTLKFNGFNMTGGLWDGSGASSSAACTLNLIGSTLNLNGAGTSSGDFNCTYIGGTIKFINTSNSAVTWSGDTADYSNVVMWFARGASTGVNTMSGSSAYGGIKDTGTAGHSLKFTAGATITVSDWLVNGTDATKLVTISSTSAGVAFTLTSPCLKVQSSDFLSLQDSVATGSSCWYAGANSTSVSGNSGWTFTAPTSSLCKGKSASGSVGVGAPSMY